MIDAIGWRITSCDNNYVHIELIGKDNEGFAELILECAEDTEQFFNDLKEAIEQLQKVN